MLLVITSGVSENHHTDPRLFCAAAPLPWTKPSRTGSHLDTLVLIGRAVLEARFQCDISADGWSWPRGLVSSAKWQNTNDWLRENPSIRSVNWLRLREQRNNRGCPLQTMSQLHFVWRCNVYRLLKQPLLLSQWIYRTGEKMKDNRWKLEWLRRENILKREQFILSKPTPCVFLFRNYGWYTNTVRCTGYVLLMENNPLATSGAQKLLSLFMPSFSLSICRHKALSKPLLLIRSSSGSPLKARITRRQAGFRRSPANCARPVLQPGLTLSPHPANLYISETFQYQRSHGVCAFKGGKGFAAIIMMTCLDTQACLTALCWHSALIRITVGGWEGKGWWQGVISTVGRGGRAMPHGCVSADSGLSEDGMCWKSRASHNIHPFSLWRASLIQKGSWKRSPDQEVATLSQRMMLHKSPCEIAGCHFFLFSAD